MYSAPVVYNYPVVPSKQNEGVGSRAEISVAQGLADIFVESELTIKTSCVLAVRHFGANVPKGNAIDLPTGNTPTVGGVIKFSYGSGVEEHHLSYIQAILKTGMWVQECNRTYGVCGERFVEFSDPAILGFWQEDVIK